MSQQTIYRCDICKMPIASNDVLRRNDPEHGIVYTDARLRLNQCYLIPIARHEGSRYEWDFCSYKCLAAFVAKRS